MPNSIADLIYSQMQTAGKPRTTTQQSTGTTTGTQTLQQKSPLDLGSLGLLLYMMLSGNKSGLGAASSPAALQPFIQGPMSSTGTLPTSSYASGQQNPIELLMRLFGGMGGVGGAGGLR